ncbi:MAG: GntR family transcriptional regulator [Pelotomaculum sp.]|uniref:Predicted transcriptional regulator n=1 Tax=Pelotomaculum thermopropionicum (strain DSM 13744 / JCM 10971 / SI) TaxID=370438 RepID=A5D5N8_PELTS|nr:GntR family transcriptional regulator [Pelotomaculum sp.]BAF58460.1 predicted transcriptional regulator [Pelotomaculum thermopropionicum SI]
MNIIISNSSQQPIYEQIAAQIKNLIIRGELAGGELLPSIRNLARELHISVITTKRAYEELEKEGFIFTVPGKGSYVAAHNKELLREARLRIVEEKLYEAVLAARSAGLTKEELREMLELLYEEG